MNIAIKRKPKVLTVLLAMNVVLACLTACSGAKQEPVPDPRIAELQREVTELKAKAAEAAKTSTLDQQAKCTDRAFKDFDDWGYKAKSNSDFASHYNQTLDRCFVQFQNTLSDSFYRELFDAYGGQQYGEYGWRPKENKKYWEVEPFTCHVTPPSGEMKYCKSDDEFKELAKVYMGD